MANEFKVKKGLIVDGTNTVLDIQGTQGQLFSVTDNLTGDIFSVSDISGIPIFNVNSDGTVTIDGNIQLADNDKIQLGDDQDLELYHDGTHSYISDNGTGELRFIANGATRFKIGSDVASLSGTDFAIGAARKLFLDGQSDTYITESSSNNIKFFTGGAEALLLDSSQNATFAGTVTANGTVLTGATDISGKVSKAGDTMTGNLNLTYAYPRINLTDTNHNSDYSIINNDGAFSIYDVTNNSHRLSISSSGNTTFAGNIVMAANATVDGVDISALPTTFAPTNAEQNVQSDWNATSGDALILNKPSIPAASGKGGNFDYVQSNLPSSNSTYRDNFGAGVWAYTGYSTGSDRPFTYDATLQVMPTAGLGFEISTGWHSTGEGKIKIRALRDCCEGWGSYYDVWTSANFTASSFISATSADTASELITFSKGISSDGDAKFYNWRALDNTSSSTDFCHRIARITGTQSTRFVIEIAGRQSSYSDNSFPAFGKIVGQLNNDNNYDITFYNFTIGTDVEAVLEVGQLDVNTTQTDIYIRHGQYAELTATAHISDGSITTYSNDSGSTGTPVGYVQSSEVEVWNSSNDGSGSGMDADYVDGLHASSFIRSDADDTASGTYTFTGSAKFALDSTFANSEVRLPATTDQNPTMMFYRPTGAAAASYPWRFQAGGGGSSSSFYIGTGSAANNGSETISNKITISSTGDLTAAGDVIAYSDAKLKENVKTLDGSKVLQMRGVSFDRKDTGVSSSGVIAQEMQKVAPELVSDDDGTLGVAYGNLTGYLIEAIKEQQKQIDELKKLIKNGNNL